MRGVSGWSRAAVLAGVGLAVAGCGGAGAEPDGGGGGAFAAIALIPGSATLAPGGVQNFVASCRTAAAAPVKCPDLTWNVTGGSRVSTSGSPDTAGTYTAGQATGSFTVSVSAGPVSQQAPVLVVPPGQAPNVSVDPTQTFQTILGWEANITGGWSTSAANRAAILDAAANEMGITRLRIPVTSSIFSGNQPDFSSLNTPMDDWGIPLRTRVLARGEAYQLLLDFRGSVPDTATYAGQVVQTLNHLKQRYNLEPDLWVIKNEPDNGQVQFTGTEIGAYLRAAGARVRAAGYNKVMFSGPTTEDAKNAVPYLQQILAVQGAGQYLAELSYHNYLSTVGTTRTSIRDAAAAAGLTTAMTEHHDATHPELYLDLTEANVSSWERNGLAGPTGFPLFTVDTQANTYSVNPDAWFLRQYFKYVRPGMTRIGASSTAGALLPTAYRAANGATVVVVRASAAATVMIGGLPAGTYVPSYTTATQQGIVGAPITITAGQTLSTSMPGSGVLTVAP